MRGLELPWRDPHPLLRTTAVALLLLGMGAVLARLSARNWTPELLIVLVVALALLVVREDERTAQLDRSDWRPWRGPHPVRDTLSLTFLGMAGISLLADPLFERLGDAAGATRSLVLTASLCGSALAQTGGRGWFWWLIRFAWCSLTAFSAWELYGALAR